MGRQQQIDTPKTRKSATPKNLNALLAKNANKSPVKNKKHNKKHRHIFIKNLKLKK